MQPRSLIFLALLGATLAAPAEAQVEGAVHHGLQPWMAAEAGMELNVAPACVGCGQGSGEGAFSALSGGLVVMPGVKVGMTFEGFVGRKTDQGVAELVGSMGPVVRLQPGGPSGMFFDVGCEMLKFGTGPSDAWRQHGDTRLGLRFGVGVAMPVTKTLSITPFIRAQLAAQQELAMGLTQVTDARFARIRIGAGLAWH